MADFFTKQNKLDLVDRECNQFKDTDDMIKWDDCSLSRREESCKHKLSDCLCVRTSLIGRRKM